jgi:hypothetical protein
VFLLGPFARNVDLATDIMGRSRIGPKQFVGDIGGIGRLAGFLHRRLQLYDRGQMT